MRQYGNENEQQPDADRGGGIESSDAEEQQQSNTSAQGHSVTTAPGTQPLAEPVANTAERETSSRQCTTTPKV